MALFRDGVKVAGQDIRVGLGKGRAQDFLRKQGILEDGKGRKHFEKDGRGEIQMIRTAVGQSEGFTFNSNFKVEFQCPAGISQPTWDKSKRDGAESAFPARGPANGDWQEPPDGRSGKVKGGSLDWKTHKMNHSTTDLIRGKFKEAAKVATTLYNSDKETDRIVSDGPAGKSRSERTGKTRSDTTLNLYCSKVTIPEKVINVAQIRKYEIGRAHV